MNRTFHLCLLLVLITLLVFIRVPSFDFLDLEDTTYLDNNPYLSKIEKSKVLELWKHPYIHYMPLTYSIWAIAGHFSEKKSIDKIPLTKTGVLKEFRFAPALFHLLPLIFHLATVFLVFWLLCFLTHHPLASFLASLLFAIHPIQVESVAWISGLKETLGGFLSILSLFLFLLGQERPPLSREYKLFFLASTFIFVLGLCSNPSTVALPWMTLVFQYFLYKKERFTVGAKRLLVWVILSIPFLFLQPQTKSWSLLPNPLTLQDKIVLTLDSLSFYFRQILLPLNLGVDYGRTPQWVLSHTSVHLTATLFFTFLFSLSLFLKWNKINWALAGKAVFLTSLIPFLIFYRFNFETFSGAPDRALYLPILGLALSLAFALKYSQKTPLIFLTSLLILVVFATRTYFQTIYWKDTTSLMAQALKINPESNLAHKTLGRFYEREEDYEKAVYHYKISVALFPNPMVYNKLGNIQVGLKNFRDAKLSFEKALSLNPLSSADYYGLGLSFIGQGDKLRALDNFTKAKALSPTNWGSLNIFHPITRDLISNNKESNISHHHK